MSSVRKFFSMDHAAEIDGIEVVVGEVKLQIARAGGSNKTFAKTLERLTRNHRRAIQFETLPEEVGQEIMYRAYAEGVVRGWEGIDEGDLIADESQYDADKKYEAVPFTADNCVALFKAQPDLFLEVRAVADSAARYRRQVLEGDSGN